MDYNMYDIKDLAGAIGKNAGVMALQAAAVGAGMDVARAVFNGEEVKPEEIVETALKGGADTGVKVVAAGALEVAVRNGIIKVIPKNTPAGVIANIACVGIEDVKIIAKIVRGEISLVKGIDEIGRVGVSMGGALAAMAGGKELAAGAAGAAMLAIGAPAAVGAGAVVAAGLVGGAVGYFAGAKVGDAIYNAGKKVVSVAKNMAKTAVKTLTETRKAVVNTIGKGVKALGKKLVGKLGL
jgi:hypothetical protein